MHPSVGASAAPAAPAPRAQSNTLMWVLLICASAALRGNGRQACGQGAHAGGRKSGQKIRLFVGAGPARAQVLRTTGEKYNTQTIDAIRAGVAVKREITIANTEAERLRKRQSPPISIFLRLTSTVGMKLVPTPAGARLSAKFFWI